jgi:hypothetical protein
MSVKVKCARCDHENEIQKPQITDEGNILVSRLMTCIFIFAMTLGVGGTAYHAHSNHLRAEALKLMIADPTIRVTYEQATGSTPELLRMNR